MFFSMLLEAVRAIGANRLRSFLTMLGMVIGVAAVVLMLAVGEGTKMTIKKQVDSLGTNVFIILAGFQNTSGVRTGSGSQTSLKESDVISLKALPGVEAVSPVVNNYIQLVAGGQNWNTIIVGVNEDYLTVRTWPLSSGRPIDSVDVQSGARNIWLGQSTAKELFGSIDPVGQTMRVGTVPFTVTGVLASKGQSLDGRDQDDTALVPITASQRYLANNRFRGSVRMIMLKAVNEEVMSTLGEDIRKVLRENHRIFDPLQDDDFFLNNLSAVMASAEASAEAMTLLLGAIASVSLAVGGIGIMNIMLVSVTERTKEIGVRLAIGARRKDILTQFLLEALLVSVTGGLLGLLFGSLGAYLVQSLWKTAVFVTVVSMVLSFTVSAAIGLFFGFYPAWKAARQNPIDALRYQ
ncbi:MAG: ABC transporter permease [Deltaproteobacteria bacterium]|jgi:putative ABC transport system permease protein|nr:ABC transporter permease [Deltaproteobacteria bacterium]